MIHKVGQRINSFRKQRNMSQEELASVLNVSRQTISKWETGDTLPDVYNAVAIANLFHVSLDELVTGLQNQYGGSSYMVQLKNRRRTFNLRAMFVGSFGSLCFGMAIVLSDLLELANRHMAILFSIVLPILMVCWGYAIWHFIKIGRISEEIKYVQKMELLNLKNNNGKP